MYPSPRVLGPTVRLQVTIRVGPVGRLIGADSLPGYRFCRLM